MDDARIAARILELVAARGPGKSICPSEVARSLAPDDWRPWMAAVRRVAARLAAEGRIAISRGNANLAPGTPLAGAIRLRLPPD